MRNWCIAGVVLVLLPLPRAAFALTLSGVMIYSTDDYGNPSAWNVQKDEFAHGQLWRTQLGGDWYGLGLLAGLPPANSDATVLNAPDFSVQIPLSDGENDFTLVGEPSVLTREDPFTHFALNLYFDGVVNRPGISVLFPRYSRRRGSAPQPNSTPVMYALSLAQVNGTAAATYTDGAMRVSVIAVSFLPPEKFGVDYDKVSAHAVVPSSTNPGPNGLGADRLGGFDYVGVLRLIVEARSDLVPRGVLGPPASAPVIPQVEIGASLGGDAADYGAPGSGEQLSPNREVSIQERPPVASGTPTDDSETTPIAAQSPTPGEAAVTAGATPTPHATALVTGAATKRPVTPTPAATRGNPTPTPRYAATSVPTSLAGTDKRREATPVPTGPKL